MSTVILTPREPAKLGRGSISGPEYAWLSRQFMLAMQRQSAFSTQERLAKNFRTMALWLGNRSLVIDQEPRVAVWAEFIAHIFAVTKSRNWAQKICTDNASLLKWMAHSGYCARDVTQLAKIPRKGPSRQSKVFTKGEYDALKEAAKTFRGGIWLWPLVVAWNTCASIGDALLLKWASVDMGKGVITFGRLKTRRPQTIPIVSGGDLYKMLQERVKEPRLEKYPNNPAGDVYFVDPYWAERYLHDPGLPIAMFRDFLDHAGISKDHSFHGFRRSFITVALDSGMSQAAVCKMSGQTSLDMSTYYYAPDHEKAREQLAYAQMSQVVGAGPVFK